MRKIERLMSELKNVTDKNQEETRTAQSDEVTGKKENGKEQDGNAETQNIRQIKKVKYSRIELINNEHEVPLSRYYVFKFSEEVRRSVNSYGIIDKVKEVSGIPPK